MDLKIDHLTKAQIREAVEYAVERGYELPEPPEQAPKNVRIRSRYRDLNARGRGTECFRLAVVGDRTVPNGELLYEPEDECPVRHVGTKPGNVHVLKDKTTGERFTVSPA